MKNKKEKREKAMLKRMNKRIGIAFLLAILLGVILVIRVIVINAAYGKEYSHIVLDHQAHVKKRIVAKRGDIVDRNGTILAYSKKVYNLLIDPLRIEANNGKLRELTIKELTADFKISKQEIIEAIDENKKSRYKKLLTNLTEEEVKTFVENRKKNKELASVAWLEDTYLRTYPFGSLAASVIGFSSNQNGGEIGLEMQYNSMLTGTDGLYYSYVDNNLETKKDIKEAKDGDTIVTTLDYGVQNIIEKAIKEYNAKKPSKHTSVIVADPNTGEILGMANYPTFDLNKPRDLSGVKNVSSLSEQEQTNRLYALWNNYCISNTFEPGSTFKSVTVAAGLEENKIKNSDHFLCRGSTHVANYNINCWRYYKGGHGDITLEEALGDSCNVAMMDVASRIGAETFIKYQMLFGFGSRTGIDLPGEERGIVQNPNYMSVVDVATNSFGQSLNINMVQMIGAYTSLVNGGNYYKPHMVKEIKNENNEIIKTYNPTILRKTVTKETSDLIKKYLKTAVDKYAVQYSKVDGYSIGGKTATAEKLPRSAKKWIVSVMTFAPVNNPKFLLYVLIDEPYGTTGGEGDGSDSQELTKTILTELLPYMGVSKENEEVESVVSAEQETGVTTPESENKEAIKPNVTDEQVRER